MSVGGQTSNVTIDQKLTDLAVEIREWSYKVRNLNTEINSGGQGLQVMQNLGYQGAANPGNPGSMTDAAYALQILAYFMDIAGVYYGNVQFGGAGGTGAVALNHDNVLSPMWAGR
jgi:hypothetical protein